MKRTLLLGTGGTIACKRTEDGLKPVITSGEILSYVPGSRDFCQIESIQAFNIDPIHFGVVMAVNLAVGLCTPPYGCNLFVGAAVAKIKMESMFKWIVPFLIVSIALILLLTYVPALSLVFV